MSPRLCGVFVKKLHATLRCPAPVGLLVGILGALEVAMARKHDKTAFEKFIVHAKGIVAQPSEFELNVPLLRR
jgi:hypothetical protein